MQPHHQQKIRIPQTRNSEIQQQLRGAMRQASETARVISQSQTKKLQALPSLTTLQFKER